MPIIYRSKTPTADPSAGWDENRFSITEVPLPIGNIGHSVCTFVQSDKFKLDADGRTVLDSAKCNSTLEDVIKGTVKSGVDKKKEYLSKLSDNAWKDKMSKLSNKVPEDLQKAKDSAAASKDELEKLPWPNADKYGLKIVRFAQEPAIGEATGFMVAPGIVATACHVVRKLLEIHKDSIKVVDFSKCKVVFNLQFDRNTKKLTHDSIYDIERIILLGDWVDDNERMATELKDIQQLNEIFSLNQNTLTTDYWDFAVLKLKPSDVAFPPALDVDAAPAQNKVFGIGSPHGLSLKVTSHADETDGPTVQPAAPSSLGKRPWYGVDMESFGGNSGGPVFSDTMPPKVVGITTGGISIEHKGVPQESGELGRQIGAWTDRLPDSVRASGVNKLRPEFWRIYNNTVRYDDVHQTVDWPRHLPNEYGETFETRVHRVDPLAAFLQPLNLFATSIAQGGAHGSVELQLVLKLGARWRWRSDPPLKSISAELTGEGDQVLRCGAISPEAGNPGFEENTELQWIASTDSGHGAPNVLSQPVIHPQTGIISEEVLQLRLSALRSVKISSPDTAYKTEMIKPYQALLRAVFTTRDATRETPEEKIVFEHDLEFQSTAKPDEEKPKEKKPDEEESDEEEPDEKFTKFEYIAQLLPLRYDNTQSDMRSWKGPLKRMTVLPDGWEN